MLARIFRRAAMPATALLLPLLALSTTFDRLSPHLRNPTIAKHSVPVATISTLVNMNKIDLKVTEWVERVEKEIETTKRENSQCMNV